MIVVERKCLSEAWVDTLGAVIADGGKSVNVVTSWDGVTENVSVRALVDDFIASRPTGEKAWPQWPVQTVANTIFPIDLYESDLGSDALQQFSDWYLEGLPVAHRASPGGEYCQRLVSWDDSGPERLNQLLEVGSRLSRYADVENKSYRYSSDYELAVENPSLDLRTQMPGRNGGPYGFPCLSHISLTVVNRVVHVTATYRNQHLLRKAYGNYLGLSRLGWALCHHAGLTLGTVTVIATHADAELGSAKGFGVSEVRTLHESSALLCRSSNVNRARALEGRLTTELEGLAGDGGFVVGVDAVSVLDFAADMRNDSFVLDAIFQPSELAECEGEDERLAVRFAAKEAVLKALGTGIRGAELRDVVVETSEQGAPSIELSGTALARAGALGIVGIECSLTHEEGFALAIVVAARGSVSTIAVEAS